MFPPPSTIRVLMDQVDALQAQVGRLAGMLEDAKAHTGVALASARGTEALAHGVIRARRERAKFLPPMLFSEPAWDLLLVLYSASLAQHRVSVSQACATANLPATTALRWLATLEECRLIVRHADPLDGRRSFVALTDTGERAMEEFFRHIKDAVLAV